MSDSCATAKFLTPRIPYVYCGLKILRAPDEYGAGIALEH